MSHTPGPWKIEEFSKGSYLVTARNAGTAKEGLVAQHVPGIANARLIAAAPELLEVIREAVDSAEREMAKGRKASPGLATWLEKARAALAKARADEGKKNA